MSWGERLQGHIAGMNYESFVRDPKTQDAASKCIEPIGLAANEANKLDPSLDAQYPQLKLSQAYKARNRLSHGYYSGFSLPLFVRTSGRGFARCLLWGTHFLTRKLRPCSIGHRLSGAAGR